MYRLYAENIKFYGQWSVWIYWRKKYGSWQHGYHKDDERYAEHAAQSGSKEEKERQKRRLIPLIHGGKAITIYRSGTPQTGLIASSEVAIEEALTNIEENYQKVKELNENIWEKISCRKS